MLRRRNIPLVRRRLPKIYAVVIQGLPNYYFVSTTERSVVPVWLDWSAASQLLRDLKQTYYGKFIIQTKTN